MEENRFCSLFVREDTLSGAPMITRIADVQDGQLVKFVRDNNREHIGDNVSRVYYWIPPAGAEPEGLVGFWNWRPREDNPAWQHSERCNLRWIEHLRFSNLSGIGELKVMLKNELGKLSLDHDYLFEYASDGKYSYCLYCPAASLTQTAGVTRLNKDIFSLPSFAIPHSDIGEYAPLRGRRFRYYARTEIGTPDEQILIYVPVKVVKEQLRKRIKSHYPSQRGERKRLNNLLDGIPDTTLVQDVATTCDVDEQTAQGFIDIFMNHCDQYFENEDIEDTVLNRVIENSAPVAERFRVAVEQDFTRHHADRIQSAQAELDQLNQQVQDATGVLVQRQQQTDALAVESADLASKISIAEQALDQVCRRLEAARKNAASLIADFVIHSQPQSVHTAMEQVSATVVSGTIIDTDPETLEDEKDALSCLSGNLAQAGVARAQSKALAAYVLSAYMSNTPLIIAGYCAQELIDALSVTLFNRTADRLYCDARGACPVAGNNATGVVAVYGSLQGQLSALLNANESCAKFHCFVVPTPEELSIEPAGLYDYALPLFTQMFIATPPKRDWYGTLYRQPAMPNPELQRRCILPQHMVSHLCRYRCAMLLDRSASLGIEITLYDELWLQTLPLMLALGKIDVLLNKLQNADLSQDQLAEIKILSGVSDE